MPGWDGGFQVPGEAAEWEVTPLQPCWSTGNRPGWPGKVQGLAGCEGALMEIPCGACTRQEEIPWIGKGCSASQSWVLLFHSNPHCPPPASSSGLSGGVTAQGSLGFPRLETLSLEQAAVCTPDLLPALPHHLPAHCDLPKPQQKSPLPAAVLSPEAHPCGSSLDTEALAPKRSERHLTPWGGPVSASLMLCLPWVCSVRGLGSPSHFCSLIHWGEGSRDLF